MSDSSSQATGGIGFLSLLAIVFIALKLTGYIAWSWWWVLAPLWWWIPIVLVLFLVIGVAQFIEERRLARLRRSR